MASHVRIPRGRNARPRIVAEVAVLAVVAGTILAACTATRTVTTTQTVTTTAYVPVSVTSTAEGTNQTSAGAAFPVGYPREVPVSAIPAGPVRSYFQTEHQTSAVAVAPGVWAELTPGATVLDAASGDVFDGYCPSIRAFNREYRGGQDSAGLCW